MAREKELDPGDLGPPWTVLKLLRWTAGYFEEHNVTQTPRLDADLLLGHVLDLDRVELYARFDTEVDDEDRAAFRELVQRRAAGEPVAYLVGERAFWQMDLYVDERVLIPRPETEVLVEEVLECLPNDGDTQRVIDVGTGSGAIALALAEERPNWEIVATDSSAGALEVASRNAERHGHDQRIGFVQGDLLDAVPEDWGPPNAIVSNPPYVPEGDGSVEISVRDHEPKEAVFGGPGGLDITSRLVQEAYGRLTDGGWLFVEMGHNQGEHVAEIFEDAGFEEVTIRTDYADRNRAVRGQK